VSNPLLKRAAGVSLRELLDLDTPPGSDTTLELVRIRAQQLKLAELFEAAASEFWPDASDIAASLCLDEERLLTRAASEPFTFVQPAGDA
jgi:hypothetical protein